MNLIFKHKEKKLYIDGKDFFSNEYAFDVYIQVILAMLLISDDIIFDDNSIEISRNEEDVNEIALVLAHQKVDFVSSNKIILSGLTRLATLVNILVSSYDTKLDEENEKVVGTLLPTRLHFNLRDIENDSFYQDFIPVVRKIVFPNTIIYFCHGKELVNTIPPEVMANALLPEIMRLNNFIVSYVKHLVVLLNYV